MGLLAAEIFGALAEAQEYKVQELNDALNEFLPDYWSQREDSYNNGQLEIYYRHVGPAWSGWLSDANEEWPWTDIEYYYWGLYYSYDYIVLARAFSQSIESPLERIEETIFDAQYHQEMAYFYEFMAEIAEFF